MKCSMLIAGMMDGLRRLAGWLAGGGGLRPVPVRVEGRTRRPRGPRP